MPRNYNDLLKVAYEIEGLIALQANRGENAIATIDEMIADKIAVLAREFDVNGVSATVETCTETFTEPCDKKGSDVTGSEFDAEAVEENLASEAETIEEKDDETADSADSVAEETAAEEAIAESALREERGDADIRPVPDMSITLDEKLARERAQDIFKAFTLNDKFRFRRELFRDSQEEFDDALNIISQMSTIDEAEEYIYDDLCWDPENDDVKAFMDIVTKHF